MTNNNLPRWLRVVRARCASARRYREFLEEVYQERRVWIQQDALQHQREYGWTWERAGTSW